MCVISEVPKVRKMDPEMKVLQQELRMLLEEKAGKYKRQQCVNVP